MVFKVETKNPIEIKRLAKAMDMASFICMLEYNSGEYLDKKALDYIKDLLQDFNINVFDLIEM